MLLLARQTAVQDGLATCALYKKSPIIALLYPTIGAFSDGSETLFLTSARRVAVLVVEFL
jgi:hypothetical protein